ncbi:MAG TPA: GFA family protein [Caulobacteraceae bacterium]|nr:GFA family protein [Caulobacteraceae bacterium]
MTEQREGGCACGAVRYRMERAPMFVHCCHCLDCQRQTGSAFVLNALIEASEVATLAGEPHVTRMPTDSGLPHDVSRCPKCETALWSTYGGRTGVRFVRIGTLDKPSALAPDVHIFTRSKVPWVDLPPDVPAFEVYYDSKTLWPAESQARRKAALAAGA